MSLVSEKTNNSLNEPESVKILITSDSKSLENSNLTIESEKRESMQ